MPNFLHLLKMFAAVFASVGSVSLLALYKFQLKLIYPNTINDAKLRTETPGAFDLKYENLHLETPDGETLHAFLLLHDKSSLDYKKKTILVLCPNAGNIGHSLPIVDVFYRNMGYNVLIYSYRGYGESTGTSDEAGLKIDADTVMKYVLNHEQLSETSIILYGRSLGGAVAVYIAAKNFVQVKAVILENTFLSIRKAIPHIFPFLKNFTYLCHQVWDSEQEITRISPETKMLFMCAELDEIVPPDHMVKLYELATATDKTQKIFKGAHHNDTVLQPSYWEIIYDFTKKVEIVEH